MRGREGSQGGAAGRGGFGEGGRYFVGSCAG